VVLASRRTYLYWGLIEMSSCNDFPLRRFGEGGIRREKKKVACHEGQRGINEERSRAPLSLKNRSRWEDGLG